MKISGLTIKHTFLSAVVLLIGGVDRLVAADISILPYSNLVVRAFSTIGIRDLPPLESWDFAPDQYHGMKPLIRIHPINLHFIIVNPAYTNTVNFWVGTVPLAAEEFSSVKPLLTEAEARRIAKSFCKQMGQPITNGIAEWKPEAGFRVLAPVTFRHGVWQCSWRRYRDGIVSLDEKVGCTVTDAPIKEARLKGYECLMRPAELPKSSSVRISKENARQIAESTMAKIVLDFGKRELALRRVSGPVLAYRIIRKEGTAEGGKAADSKEMVRLCWVFDMIADLSSVAEPDEPPAASCISVDTATGEVYILPIS